MCTVSWRRTADSYTVFFNRDERRSRRPAREPAVRERAGVKFLAPTDGDAGGTWLAVNERGVCVGLLNGYQAQDPPEPAGGYTSRGLLVSELAVARDAAGVRAGLEALPLERYRAFVLAVWTPEGTGPVVGWSAAGLREDPHAAERPPLSSSSFDPERVIASRAALYAATVESVDEQLAYHRSHTPARGPLSPCMHRPDAHTVSFSRIDVDGERVSYAYAPTAPCRAPTTVCATLPRRR